MKSFRWALWCSLSLFPVFFIRPTGSEYAAGAGRVNVLTQRYDNNRAGANLNETALNTANVNALQFGKLFSLPVDGYIYAQPLYVAQLGFPDNSEHNVVYVATEHNSVYAFDADDPDAAAPLWQVNLGTPVPSTDISPTYRDLTPEIGITSTPVIDLAGRTIYVVAKSKNITANTCHQRLHALDLATGQEKPGSPVEITAGLSGAGAGAVNGVIQLDPLRNLNRPGLLLLDGVVYIAFGSHGGASPYHGWVLGYDGRTLQQVAVFCTTPDGDEGSVWQSGQGLVADAESHIYLVTGNGTFNGQTGGRNYGDSALKLRAGNGLAMVDSYTPFNEADLNALDTDLGSGGPVLLPGFNRLIFTGKDTVLRVLDTNNLGRFDPQIDQIIQRFQPSTRRMLGAPVYWDSPNNGPVIYYWAEGDYLKVFQLINGRLQEYPAAQSTIESAAGYSNAPPMSISARQNKAGTGILWATGSVGGDANRRAVPGILRAFDATDVTRELWNSRQNAARDEVGNFAKFCPPMVANGKVYVATFSGQLQVYGLLPEVCGFSLSQTEQSLTAGNHSGSIDVITDAACRWLATSDDEWITLASDNEGSGSGAVSFLVAPNPTSKPRIGGINVAGLDYIITQAGAAAVVSAASFLGPQLAGDSIATAYGSALANGIGSAGSQLPISLAGTSVRITDSTGMERAAPIFFVSPTQVNFLMPGDMPLGNALISIAGADGSVSTTAAQIARVAPGIFSANATGRGLAAAVALRVKADGSQTFEPVARFDQATNQFVGVPIDLGPETDQVFLVPFGTGFRNRSSLNAVSATVGGTSVQVTFAGAQGSLIGLDQATLLLPRSIGRGEVDVVMTVDNLPSNTVRVSVK